MLLVLMFQLGTNAAQPTLEMKIDRFITHQMTTQHIPGLALAITHEDQVMYIKGYGKANVRQSVTPQTQFPIASLSKSFTAIAVLQLVEAGKIDLDIPVKQYLQEFTLADTKMAAQITIRQLLNHTSGLSDWSFSKSLQPPPTNNAERVNSLHNAHLVAAPSAEFHYFNPNYDVLARVVEVVSGQAFGEYLQSHIFIPLQMSQTFHATTMTEALQQGDRMATGHLMAFAIPLIAFALPHIKSGLIQLLTEGMLPPDGFNMNSWGISLAILTIIGVALAIRSLLCLPQWKRNIHAIPKGQLLLEYRMDVFSVRCCAGDALVSRHNERSHLQLSTAFPSHARCYALAKPLCRTGVHQRNNTAYCLRR
jgi:CubicO group peptidase (beta-lactamase class C family)